MPCEEAKVVISKELHALPLIRTKIVILVSDNFVTIKKSWETGAEEDNVISAVTVRKEEIKEVIAALQGVLNESH